MDQTQINLNQIDVEKFVERIVQKLSTVEFKVDPNEQPAYKKAVIRGTARCILEELKNV